jgi:hypothetical protein
MTFTPPATNSGDYVKIGDLNGHLCIFTPTEFIESITTSMGDSTAIKADIVDLDSGEEHEGVLLFNKALITSLKANIGAQVLARVGQGIAKPGKSAPWILNDATTDATAVNKATAYLAIKASAGLTQPAKETPSAVAPAGGLSTEALAALAGVADVSDPAIAAALAKLANK